MWCASEDVKGAVCEAQSPFPFFYLPPGEFGKTFEGARAACHAASPGADL